MVADIVRVSCVVVCGHVTPNLDIRGKRVGDVVPTTRETRSLTQDVSAGHANGIRIGRSGRRRGWEGGKRRVRGRLRIRRWGESQRHGRRR